MKKITLFMALFMSCTLLQVNAQTEITQAGGTVNACSDFQDGDIYTDSGGSAGNYSNFESSTMVFQAPAGETVTIEFTSFQVETNWDSLTVTGDTGGFDGLYDGTSNPPTMTSAVGGALTFDMFSDSSFSQAGWTANIGISGCPPPPPYLFSQDCSEEMPLEFAPPIIASAGVMVADSGFPSDTGVVGSGLGEYVIESIVLNAQAGSAQDVDFSLQSPNGTLFTLKSTFGAGGTDGMDTAVDLVFTDSSSNSQS